MGSLIARSVSTTRPPPVRTRGRAPTTTVDSGGMLRSTSGRNASAMRRMSRTLVNDEAKVPGIATTPTRMSQTVPNGSQWVVGRGQ